MKHFIFFITIIILMFIISCNDKNNSQKESEQNSKSSNVDNAKTEFAKNVKLYDQISTMFLLMREKNYSSITKTAHYLRVGGNEVENVAECDFSKNQLDYYVRYQGKFKRISSTKLDENGKILSWILFDVETDAKLEDHKYNYNSEGVLIKKEGFNDTGEKSCEELYKYDQNQNLLTVTKKYLDVTADIIWFVKFDETGKEIENVANDNFYRTVYKYDSLNRVVSNFSTNKWSAIPENLKYHYGNTGLLTEIISYGSDNKPITRYTFKYSNNRSKLIQRNKGENDNDISSQVVSSKEEIQSNFKSWLFRNTAVTEVRFESDWQIWVTLEPYKYTSEENVEEIASTIARWYAQKMNKSYTVCTVWRGNEIYAKGSN